VAVIVTCHVVNNDLVVTVNVAVVLPAGIAILAGTLVTRVLLVFSETATPPAGAGPLKVTVPVAGVPPATVVGLTERDDSVTPVMVSVAVLLTLL